VRFDEDERGGVTVVVDGHPQSYVSVADPMLLAFDYVEHLALAINALAPTPAPAALRVTHIGGAGLTLARWITATRPGSPQIVLEPDAPLTAAVRARLPLPRGHRVRVRPVDGRSGIAALASASADVVVLDAFAAGRVPADLVSVEFFAQVCRVLTPRGLCVANLADEPGLRHAARVVAAVQAAGLDAVSLIAGHEVLKGKRFGNVVIAARAALDPESGSPAGVDALPRRAASASQPGGIPAEGMDPLPRRAASASQPGGIPAEGMDTLRRQAASASLPTGIRAGAALTRWLAGARPFTDADAIPSPEPPDPGAWRFR